MKKHTANQLGQQTHTQSNNVHAVANETAALHNHQSKAFSFADLWNIQRRGTTMLQRRNYV